jgi:hypothetical protein
MSDEPAELRPARPDVAEAESRAYMPRLPWGWMALATALVTALVFAYYSRQLERVEELREALLTAHEENVGALAGRYMTFRRQLEERVVEAAAGGRPEPFVHPRLNLAGLRNAEGLYLRVTTEQAADADGILDAAVTMTPDAINRCLGLGPASLSGFYQRGDFLTPAWVERTRESANLNSLQLYDHQLRRHLEVDAPAVAEMLRAEWFLLVVQRGEDRQSAPVDVFLWDLPRDRQLLRARIQGRGVLLPVRMAGTGGPRLNGPVFSPGATDCSIASQLRALTGHDAVEVETAPPVTDPDEGGVAEGAAEDAAASSAEPETEPEGAAAPTE